VSFAFDARKGRLLFLMGAEEDMRAVDEGAAALEKVTALFKTERNGEAWDEWEVLEMDVQEGIGQPTHGRLVIAASSQNFDFSPMLGKSCVLILSRGYDRKRYFKGLVFRIEHRGEYPFGSVARVDFASAVWGMRHGQDSRVWENQTAPQIIEEVFKEALEPFGREVRLSLSRTYAAREYCAQYKESDWNFVQRLMSGEGISFYFDDGKKETDWEMVVLVDSNDAFPAVETMGGAEAAEQSELLAAPMDFATAGQSAADATPRYLRFRLHADGNPRAAKAYTLTLDDGRELNGKTTGDGLVVQEVPAGARWAKLRIEGALGMEEYSLSMGGLDALSRPSGVERRLNHLGLLDGQGGRGGEETRAAIACFQDRHGIEPSGELDGATRKKLEEVHGT
jgi:uncharacterized protein involved in type VI secretion and phage assembly